MRFLTSRECEDWASKQGFRFGARPNYRSLEETGFRAIHFPTPSDAGRRVALARALWHALSTSSERLLWVTEWSVWPSGEHVPLYQSLRRAFGDARHLIEAPGHLFDEAEDDAGLSFLVTSLLFLWDAHLLPAGGTLAAFVSHDEYCVVLSADPRTADTVKQRLASFIEPAI